MIKRTLIAITLIALLLFVLVIDTAEDNIAIAPEATILLVSADQDVDIGLTQENSAKAVTKKVTLITANEQVIAKYLYQFLRDVFLLQL